MKSFPRFGLLVCLLVVLAHAVAYMMHEYAHSLTAWALGWMEGPLALDYGPPTLYNLLFLGEVSDNVQYDPIFASGHGLAAATIALAGTVLGSALPYIPLAWIARRERVGGNPALLATVYLLALMCAGNVFGYVPIRTITTHADIAIAARGLGLSVWVVLPLLLTPALAIFMHFFRRLLPFSVERMANGSVPAAILVVVLTCYWFFAFFGGDGTSGSYGLTTQLMALASKYVAFPLSTAYLAARYAR